MTTPQQVSTDSKSGSSQADAQEYDPITTTPSWTSSIRELSGSPAYAQAQGGSDGSLTPQDNSLLEEWKAVYELVTGEPWKGAVGQTSSAVLGLTEVARDKSGWVVAVRLHGHHHVDERFALLTRLPHLVQLDLSNVDSDSITDRALAHLGNCENLQWLDLGGLKINVEALEHVRKLRRLRYLNLAKTRVMDSSLELLSDLTSLEHLNIEETKVSNNGLRHLSKLVNVRQLRLGWHPSQNALRFLNKLTMLESPDMILAQEVTGYGKIGSNELFEAWIYQNRPLTQTGPVEIRADRGTIQNTIRNRYPVNAMSGKVVLPVLAGMTQFQSLDLSGIICDDADLKHLSKMTALRVLNLRGAQISRDGLQHLRDLQELRYLNLGGTDIGDGDVEELANLKRLTDVELTGSFVTSSGAKKLEALLPRIKVSFNPRFDIIEAFSRELQR